MKKKFLGILACLFLSTSVFGLDKFINSYQPMFGNCIITGDYSGNEPWTAYYGYRAGLVWDKFSLNTGFTGLFSDFYIDLGYNFINTDNMVLSAGALIEIDTWIYPGFGPSVNFDYLIPINEKITLDLGVGATFLYFPTLSNYYSAYTDSNTSIFVIQVMPRIGTSTKL